MDIERLSLELLHRPPLADPLLRPEDWDDAPLVLDLERLADPAVSLDKPAILRLLVKFFHAYVHDSQRASLSLDEATLLFEQFAQRRHGCACLDGRLELRRKLLTLGFALCMVADLSKSGAILWDILHQEPPTAPNGPVFHGLDIGAGTGLLMLGMWLLARREGHRNIDLLGLERNEPVARRSNELMRDLGVGRVVAAEAKRPETYAPLTDELDFVANETLPSQGHSLWREDFLAINRVLFERCAEQLRRTRFFPSAVLVSNRRGQLRLVLHSDNAFSPDGDYPPKLLTAQGIAINGHIVNLESVGEDWRELLPVRWLPRLTHRW